MSRPLKLTQSNTENLAIQDAQVTDGRSLFRGGVDKTIDIVSRQRTWKQRVGSPDANTLPLRGDKLAVVMFVVRNAAVTLRDTDYGVRSGGRGDVRPTDCRTPFARRRLAVALSTNDHRRSQGGAERDNSPSLPPRCPKIHFNKKCAKFLYFSTRPCSRGSQRPFRDQECPPLTYLLLTRGVAPPRQILGYAHAHDALL